MKSIKQVIPNFLLKDKLFPKEDIIYLSKIIKKIDSNFDDKKFVNTILNNFKQLELKQRITEITNQLDNYLEGEYTQVLNKLIKTLPTQIQGDKFIFASFSEYVSTHGLSKKHLDISLNSLAIFTRFFSSEFAIRDFINHFPDQTFIKLKELAISDNLHHRRFASEGLRPKLPWAKAITFDYKQGAKILDYLFFDKERYVTRSVANHLNDISKIDPDFVLKILNKWKKSGKQNDNEMNYIINHSLRTLIKRGHINTFLFLGYNEKPQVKISNLEIKNKNIIIGDYLEFNFDVFCNQEEKIIIDYKIIFPSFTKRISQKVFKLKKIDFKKLQKIQKVQVNKKHLFKQMTTKRLYSGDHELVILINGQPVATKKFNLNVD